MNRIIISVVFAITLLACHKISHVENLSQAGNTANKTNPVEERNNPKQIKVLTLGSFHFSFPNLDVIITDDDDKIDVLEPKHQEEIEMIVTKLEKFRPTIIVIERLPKHQQKYDSLYQSYLKGTHELTRSEEQQIGFRLAKRMSLKRLYCTDAWGMDYKDVKQLLDGKDSIAKQRFADFFYNNPDSLLYSYKDEKEIFKTQGILAELKRLNDSKLITDQLGDYLIGPFKYETPGNNQFGADFTTGWWFNRNLRIFRNIQRIDATPEDRILVIYGAGHLNLLNIFFKASPEYELLQVKDYLK